MRKLTSSDWWVLFLASTVEGGFSVNGDWRLFVYGLLCAAIVPVNLRVQAYLETARARRKDGGPW